MKSILFAIGFLCCQLASAQFITSTQDFILVNRTVELISDSGFIVFDSNGKLTNVKSTTSGRLILIDFTGLAAGVYVVKTKERIYRYYVL